MEVFSFFEYFSIFEKEKIDMEFLFMCIVDDLKEMGIFFGFRKKIVNFVEYKVVKLKKVVLEKKVVVVIFIKG